MSLRFSNFFLLKKFSGYGHFARECPSERRGGSDDPKCYNCGKFGHISRDCPDTGTDQSKRCYNCQEIGHISRDCPRRDWKELMCREWGRLEVVCVQDCCNHGIYARVNHISSFRSLHLHYLIPQSQRFFYLYFSVLKRFFSSVFGLVNFSYC